MCHPDFLYTGLFFHPSLCPPTVLLRYCDCFMLKSYLATVPVTSTNSRRIYSIAEIEVPRLGYVEDAELRERLVPSPPQQIKGRDGGTS